MNDITERMEEKESRARLPMDGWIEKGGEFSIGVRSKVLFINRTTRMKGTFVRESSYTALRGYVSEGVPPAQIGVVMVALVLIVGAMLINGQALLAIAVGLIAAAAYVPLVGDHHNSVYLIKELKRILGAKEKPPVATASAQSAKAPAKKPATSSTTKPKSNMSTTTATPTKKPAPSSAARKTAVR